MMEYPGTTRYFLCLAILLLSVCSVCFGQRPAAGADSYKVLHHSTSRYFVARQSVTTRDNGTAIAGKWGENEDESDLLLMKLDPKGAVAWARKIVNGRRIDEYRVIELKDGSLLFAGNSIYNNTAAVADILLVKVTCKGDIVYSKNLTMNDTRPKGELELFSLTEGRNGDALISFYNGGRELHYSVVCRVNTDGILVWSKTFYSHDETETVALQCLYNGASITAMGLRYTANYWSTYKSIIAMQLNYETGNTELIKGFNYSEFQTNYGLHITRADINCYAELLQDGSFALFGIFGHYDKQSHYFYSLYLNKDFTIRSTAVYSVPETLGRNFAKIRVFPDGQTHFMATKYEYERSYWWSIDEKGNTIRQKKMYYPGAYVHHQYKVNPDNYGGAIAITSYMKDRLGYLEVINAEKNNPSIEDCIGDDTIFVSKKTWQVFKSSESWQRVEKDEAVITDLALVSEPVEVFSKYICAPANAPTPGPPATKLSIQGEDSVCHSTLAKSYVARTSNAALVQWYMDPDSYTAMQKLNDSTISISFKFPGNQPVEAKLYATTGACDPLIDSITITLLPAPVKLPESPDMCTLPLTLNPGHWFKTYRWQDGSTNASYEIKKPGTYYVAVQSFCGDTYTDTVVVVRPTTGVPQNLSVCYDDTVSVKAADGFQSYQWQPAYNMQPVNERQVDLFPYRDTFYILRAMLNSGCEISDTVYVQVNQASPVSLGPDAEICPGDIVNLDAGHSYLLYNWNTGQTTSQITVQNAGHYYVIATDNNGCDTRDSILVSLKQCTNEVYVPTAFTPNKDGKNDVFKPIVAGIVTDLRFVVYNRWGEIVFVSSQGNAGWTGDYKGTVQPVGAYVWTLQYRPLNGETIWRKGSVVLVR